MSEFPAALKPLKRFLLQANQVQKVQPKVAYYCRVYAITLAMSLPKEDKDALVMKFVGGLFERLEKDKSTLDLNQDGDAAVVEAFAEQVFQAADSADRQGKANKSTARAFQSAAVFYESLRNFGSLETAVAAKIRYSQWKAMDIAKALREGRTPTPGGFEDESVSPTSGAMRSSFDEDDTDDKQDSSFPAASAPSSGFGSSTPAPGPSAPSFGSGFGSAAPSSDFGSAAPAPGPSPPMSSGMGSAPTFGIGPKPPAANSSAGSSNNNGAGLSSSSGYVPPTDYSSGEDAAAAPPRRGSSGMMGFGGQAPPPSSNPNPPAPSPYVPMPSHSAPSNSNPFGAGGGMSAPRRSSSNIMPSSGKSQYALMNNAEKMTKEALSALRFNDYGAAAQRLQSALNDVMQLQTMNIN